MDTTTAALTIHPRRRGAELGDMFGIFFEDINHAADGGLYAELVQNRSFEFDPIDHREYHALTAWETVERGGGKAAVTIETSHPLNERNPHYAVIEILAEGAGVGILNQGFNSGISLTKGESYLFSVYARRDNSFNEPLVLTLESHEGVVHAEASITVDSAEWRKYEVRLTAQDTDVSSRLVLVTTGSGKLYLDMVSLFPEATFRGRPGGMRKDISEWLAALKPKFMRFPGGCLIHDGSLNPDARDSLYHWKNTLGDVAQRPSRRNNWSYNQTLGLGYYEYFQFCEDIGAKPLPVLPGGYNPHRNQAVPLDELEPWIQDALDLIEFANGDSSTPWGSKRAELGHPEPFGLEYVGIGNEEVGEPFFERYPYFHRAIKERYPDIKVINSSGPFAAGSEYDRGWNSAKGHGSDLVDEHYYQSPEWFLANYHRYDNFKADEPKVFLGEFASWGNSYYNALAEAAYMTGLERNAHAVGLVCYAPMLCNADYVNWKPDMIWFNNHQVYGTPNYYVQKLFMNHHGDQLLAVEGSGFSAPQAAAASAIIGPIVLTASNTAAEFYDIELLNRVTGEKRTFSGLSPEVNTMKDLPEGSNIPRVLELGETGWEHYTLSLKARRTAGPKGFIIEFGRKDDHNRLFWELGGWLNQDTMVCAVVDGRNSVLTQSMFSVETDVEYSLVLEVSGREIRTYIDGELVNETEDKLPTIEPLYYTASMELSSGDIILKAVNVQAEAVTAHINIDDNIQGGMNVDVFELSGHNLEDENSFEHPEQIVPQERSFSTEESGFAYTFPKQSVTVFRIRQRVSQ
ncbi:alpha-L-arabinofuranosidase C-terminal domain-containing protein [Paenibacillus donghaensis]|uniref:non-reducing end alpha-L-arabinofuranosidase n=1 Tax=Paenibacillus donghaensis TaxID=414771 RepID=A0A2Z2KKD2_9BACL|nr:alpha-L-arabinofuranosidase C-terminal domain-containing protein [Paenibacillus donghaensis]ASA21442.1 alpha-L-arabinofuranosidase [Paenibacillus donghaensis]